jgi:hypothetical protein
MTHPKDVADLIKDTGGTVTSMTLIDDGEGGAHGVATASFPLPKDHWLFKDGFAVPPMPFRMGTSDPRRQEFNEMVRAAARYAVRAATMNGKSEDFDPDAMEMNFVIGMLGYHTPDGLDSESWANPDPVPPPRFGIPEATP